MPIFPLVIPWESNRNVLFALPAYLNNVLSTLQATQRYFDDAADVAGDTRRRIATLMAGIQGNLERESKLAGERSRVVIPAEIVSGASLAAVQPRRPNRTNRKGELAAQAGGGGGVTVIAFTCGHCFLQELFWTTVIPNFTKRMEAMRRPIKATLRLLLEEYHKPCPSLACPICLYNSLRKEEGRRKPHYT